MRKGLIVLLVAVVAVAFALPAMADMTPTNLKVSGFYRAKSYVSNFFDVGGAPSLRTGTSPDAEQTNAYVEQRFRVKFQFGTENVQAVWFLESDMLWGDTAGGNNVAVGTAQYTGGAQRNSGGALGADRIQTETKNVYVWFKVPDTSLDFTVGLQNQSDDYAGIIYGGADFAGIFMNGQFEPVKYKLGWAKLYENAVQKSDDMTLYYSHAAFAPAKDVQLGLSFYYLQDDTAKVGIGPAQWPYANAVNLSTSLSASVAYFFAPPNKMNVYMPGIDVAFKAGPVTVSGFAQYQFGKIDYLNNTPLVKDIDISAWMVDLRGDMNVMAGKAFLEGLYMSGSDNPTNEYKAPISLALKEASPGGNSAYTRTNMYTMLASPDTINVSQCLIGCSGGEMGTDLGNSGRGLWHVAAGYEQPLTKQLKGQVNVGYLAAVERLKDPVTGQTEDRKGNGMGTEVNARLDYNILKGLDVGVVGSYVWLGDFFTSRTTGESFKDPWTGYARINYAY